MGQGPTRARIGHGLLKRLDGTLVQGRRSKRDSTGLTTSSSLCHLCCYYLQSYSSSSQSVLPVMTTISQGFFILLSPLPCWGGRWKNNSVSIREPDKINSIYESDGSNHSLCKYHNLSLHIPQIWATFTNYFWFSTKRGSQLILDVSSAAACTNINIQISLFRDKSQDWVTGKIVPRKESSFQQKQLSDLQNVASWVFWDASILLNYFLGIF